MTNLKIPAILCLLLLPVCLTAAVPDSSSVLRRINAKQALLNGFFPLIFANPALKPFQYDSKLTSIRFETQHERETEAITIHNGDGQQFNLLDVDSYIPLDNSTLWGDASYSNGKRFHVKFNETSDPDILYPYLAGDTTGGNLQSEVYRFSGGYARFYDRFSWGIQAAFRASQEYRAVDPRPGNIASDLDLALGGSFRIVPSYAIALALHLRKYKQKNEIEFYNELGDVKVYHYTGLGTDYFRFRTKADKLYYNGNAAGASLYLFPQRSQGFVAALKYNRFNFGKVISPLNELNLTDMKEQTLEWETGYRKTASSHAAAFKIDGYFLRRAGWENIFGDEASNNYPFLISLEQYRRKIVRLRAVALYEHYAGSLRWAVQPLAGYETETEKYTYPARKISRTHFTPELRIAFAKSLNKISFSADAVLKHYFPVNNTLALDGTVGENFSAPVLSRNHELLAGKRTALSLDGRINYAFRQDYALFAALLWQRGQYVDNIKTDYISICCGINF
jgi:hypothetical protein